MITCGPSFSISITLIAIPIASDSWFADVPAVELNAGTWRAVSSPLGDIPVATLLAAARPTREAPLTLTIETHASTARTGVKV
jgi:hypothetical protein